PVARRVAEGINFDITNFHLPLLTLALQILAAVLMPVAVAAFPILAGARLTIREAISDANAANTVQRGFIDWLLVHVKEMPQLLKISIRNTFRRKGRLALTFAALSLAGAMFIAIAGIRQSLHQAVGEITAALGYDVGIDFAQPYPADQLERLALRVPGVEQVESWGIVDARHVYQDDRLSSSFTLLAVPPTTDMARPSITTGGWLSPNESGMLFVNADTRARIPDMVAGTNVRLRIGGDERTWTVAGVGSRELVAVGYIDYADFERITHLDGYANRLVVRTADSSFDFQNTVEQDLLKQYNDGGMQIINSATTAKRKQAPGHLDVVIGLLMSMTIIIAVVGGLGLAITMGLNVMERTREIGILRSLGATGGVVRRTVIGEGLVIGLISWAIGTVLSIPLGIWLGNSLGMSLLARPLDYIFSVAALLIWLALVILIAVVASLIPAHHAAQLTIRDTLAYAG
ncbi:MAG: ABC transporter, fused permease protein, partial [uncultured Chloroflexia bacterium]